MLELTEALERPQVKELFGDAFEFPPNSTVTALFRAATLKHQATTLLERILSHISSFPRISSLHCLTQLAVAFARMTPQSPKNKDILKEIEEGESLERIQEIRKDFKAMNLADYAVRCALDSVLSIDPKECVTLVLNAAIFVSEANASGDTVANRVAAEAVTYLECALCAKVLCNKNEKHTG